jgi:hypothetical protein
MAHQKLCFSIVFREVARLGVRPNGIQKFRADFFRPTPEKNVAVI